MGQRSKKNKTKNLGRIQASKAQGWEEMMLVLLIRTALYFKSTKTFFLRRRDWLKEIQKNKKHAEVLINIAFLLILGYLTCCHF